MKDSHPIIQLFCFKYPPELSLHGDVPKQTSLCYEVRCSNVGKYHNSYMVKRDMELYEGQIKDKIPSKFQAKYYCN